MLLAWLLDGQGSWVHILAESHAQFFSRRGNNSVAHQRPSLFGQPDAMRQCLSSRKWRCHQVPVERVLFFVDAILQLSQIQSRMGKRERGCWEKRNKTPIYKRFPNLETWKRNTSIFQYIRQRDSDFPLSPNFKALTGATLKIPKCKGVIEIIGMIPQKEFVYEFCFHPSILCPPPTVINLNTKCEKGGLLLSLVYTQGIYDPNNFFP